MRDHPLHNVEMMGGMFGMRHAKVLSSPDNSTAHDKSNRGSMNLGDRAKMFSALLASSRRLGYKGLDQALLRRHVWVKRAKWDSLVHDSYKCQFFGKNAR